MEKEQISELLKLADFLAILAIKAKDFATELTSHNVLEKDLKLKSKISKEHVDNNVAVREMLKERGIKPEQLPAGEDTTKVKRRIISDERNILKGLNRPQRLAIPKPMNNC